MNSNTNDSNGKGWALSFGLLAGIAIGYYLNSNEGRAARRKAQVQFDEYGNQVSTRANELAAQARVKGQEYLDTAKKQVEAGKQWATETAETVRSTVNQQAQSLKSGATNSANTVADSFKRGMDKAKHNIDDKSDKIEDIVQS